MNKKGIFMFYVLIFTILSVTLAISYFWVIESEKTSFEIGGSQTDVVKSFMVSREVKYYTGSSLGRFSNDSIASLLANSGIKEPVLRDDVYVLWKKAGKECFPDDWEVLKEILSEKVEEKFDEEVMINIYRKPTELSIEAKVPISISYEGENYKVEYSDNYTSEYLVKDFNFDVFINKVNEVEDVVSFCGSNKACWEEETSDLEWFSLVRVKDKLFKFEFTTFGLNEEITVKAAVDFEKELNIGEEELKC